MVLGRTYTYIIKSRLAVSVGEVVDREMKHPGEEASGHLGASGKEASGIRGTRAFLGWLALGPGKEASGIRGARVLGWRVARAFLGRLAFKAWKGGVRDKRRLGTRAEGCLGVPGVAGFRVWSHRGSWAGPVG